VRLRLAVLLAALGLPLALWAALPVGSSGAPSTGVLQHKIDKREAQIRSHRGREQVLTTDISADSRKIAGLQGDITRLQTRQVRLEGSLAA
jgi:hypothetical protein